MQSQSYFSNLPLAQPIQIFHLKQLYEQETDPRKVNLGSSSYRTEEGAPYVLPVVREAERRLADDKTLDHEYLDQLGDSAFCDKAVKLVLGEQSPLISDGRAIGVQCLSGTGSLRMGAEFLFKSVGLRTVCLSQPTWDNHELIFERAGFGDIRRYRYWDHDRKCIDFEGLAEDLEAAPATSIIILQCCAHVPTGIDLTKDQWMSVEKIIQRRQLYPFFDMAYQGLSSGDLGQDAWPIRFFAEKGHELLVAQSFAKNFGLYNERVGCLTVVTSDSSNIPAVKSHLSTLARANWSNPPSHGSKIVLTVLNDEALKTEWKNDLKTISQKLKERRKELHDRLTKNTKQNWDFLLNQTGFIGYSGFTAQQCEFLQQHKKVFIHKDGRICFCGLTCSKIDYLADCIAEAITDE